VNNLYKENAKLKSQLVNINEKNKTLSENLDKKKREIGLLKKQQQHQMVPPKSLDRPSSVPSGGGVQIFPAKSHPHDLLESKDSLTNLKHASPSEANLLAIAQKLKQR
jgi:hypothetical protein